MKERPLLWAFLAVLSGEVMAILVPGRWLFAGALALSASAFVIDRKKRQKKSKRYFLLALLFMFGVLIMLYERRPSELETAVSEINEVTAVVNDIRMTSQGSYRMEAGEVLIYLDEKPEACPGDIVIITGTFKELSRATNPGQFDAYEYYHSKGLSIQADEVSISITGKAFRPFARGMYLIRQRLLSACDAMSDLWATNSRYAEDIDIIKGMFLGEKSMVPTEVRNLFNAAGIAHMLAVSGLHIGIIGMRTFRVLKKNAGFSYQHSVLISALIIFAYCLMCGFSPSSVRAMVMFCVMITGEARGKQYDMLSAMSASGIATCIIWPMQITQAAFQISYLAVFGMGFSGPIIADFFRNKGSKKNVALPVINTFAIQITTFPAVVWHYYKFSISGMFLNLFVIPALPIIAGASFAAVIVGLLSAPAGAVIFMPVYFSMEMLKFICTMVNKIPFSELLLGRPSAACVVIYSVLLCVLLYFMSRTKAANRLKKKIKANICLIFLVCSLLFVRRFSGSGLKVYFLDVGQGDGIFIELPSGETMLIDGGSSSVNSVGKYRIMSFLDYMGIDEVDMAFVSHMDEDHVNGIKEIIEAERIGKVYLSCLGSSDKAEDREAFAELCSEHDVRVSEISSGDEWSDGRGVTMICVYPDNDMTVDPDDENDASLVLFFRYAWVSMLFTGDVTSEREDAVLESLEKEGFTGPLTVLKAGHHGSRYSTGEEFLNFLNPRLAVLSYGKNNRYGHPADETVLRLEEAGARIARTPDGCVRITTDEEGNVFIARWVCGKYT